MALVVTQKSTALTISSAENRLKRSSIRHVFFSNEKREKSGERANGKRLSIMFEHLLQRGVQFRLKG